MDLPPSGWYPDPYGTPSLLRWWDGSGWTQHTHPDVTAGAGGSGVDPAATTVQSATGKASAVQGAAVQETTVQGATVLGNTGLGNTGLGNTVQATAAQPAATAVQASPVPLSTGPSAEWLSRTKPPTGRPTAPQPALPAFPGAAVGVAPTAYQPQVTSVLPGQMGQAGGISQPGGMQPTPGQPTIVQPGYPQPGTVPPVAGQAGAGDGTQVLFLGGDSWQVPGAPVQGNPYGYMEAQRRRRRRVIIGITAGTAVAVAAIVIIATSLSSSPSTPVANQTAAAPAPTASAASPTPTQSASPTASPTTTGSLLTDGQAGLSYMQLSAPWQGASCPNSLTSNGAFPWTAGEYAVAGQVNNGSNTWYGEACSGLLPQDYGYSGTGNLQTTTENLAQTFSNAYYGALDHTINQEQDQPLQVSGHAGWEVTYDVSYTNASDQGASWNDEQASVVIVDNGTNQPAVFFTSIPQNLNEDNINKLVSSLQLTSGSATAGQGSATPTDGSQNGGSQNGGNGDGSNP
jgi:hypothetical protein